jgi:hypothetical protein
MDKNAVRAFVTIQKVIYMQGSGRMIRWKAKAPTCFKIVTCTKGKLVKVRNKEVANTYTQTEATIKVCGKQIRKMDMEFISMLKNNKSTREVGLMVLNMARDAILGAMEINMKGSSPMESKMGLASALNLMAQC